MFWNSQIVSQNALLLHFETEDAQLDLDAVSIFPALTQKLQHVFQSQLIDIVPSYASIMLIFDITKTRISQWHELVIALLEGFDFSSATQTQSNTIEIPVYYSTQTGPDLSRLAREKNVTEEQFIELHTRRCYTVYAIGFTPGFAYMGFVSETLASPRLSTPRLKVPKGSVGIADKQTGIYPMTSPGGWNIIGRTPTELIQRDKNGNPACIVSTGDKVQFRAIGASEYAELGGDFDV